jgi:hypothetical protein
MEHLISLYNHVSDRRYTQAGAFTSGKQTFFRGYLVKREFIYLRYGNTKVIFTRQHPGNKHPGLHGADLALTINLWFLLVISNIYLETEF